MLTFFRDKVLAAARPQDEAGGLGVEATIRAAVDAAEPGIGAAFEGRSLAEALIRDTLGQTYSYLGEAELAIRQHERSRQLLADELGESHPNTLTATNNLALAYESVGRPTEALELYERTLELRKAKLGGEHPDTLVSMNNLAAAYRAGGRLAEALQLFERTLELREAKLGPEHRHTLSSVANLAEALLADGQPEKALPLIARFVAGQRRQVSPGDPALAGVLESVSLVLLQHAQYQAAEAYLRECLAIREKNEADGWTTFNTRSLLGGSLLGQRDYAEAESLLLAGYEGLNQREAEIAPESKRRLTEALERLVQLYDTWEKKAEADKWRTTLDEHKAALESSKGAEVLKSNNSASAR
ncbi:MAG: tetratricopeptide repeat protein [Pirellulales bacterium]